jgi:hypothetical protein
VSRLRRNAVLEGALVIAGMLLVPLALAAALRASVAASLVLSIDALVGVAAATWTIVAWSLVGNVRHLLHHGGSSVEPGPIAWAAVRVASLLLLLAPLLGRGTSPSPPKASPVHAPATTALSAPLGTPRDADEPRGPREGSSLEVRRAPTTHESRSRRGGHRRRAEGAPQLAGALVPLAAELRRKRRRSERIVVDDESVLDAESRLLGASAGAVFAIAGAARALAASGRLRASAHLVVRGGEACLDDGTWSFDPAAPQCDARCVVVVLGTDAAGVHLVLVPRGASLALAGPGAATLLDDAMRVAPVLDTGCPVVARAHELLDVLARRADDDVVVCVARTDEVPTLRGHCVLVDLDASTAFATVDVDVTRLHDGRALRRDALSPDIRDLLDGRWDRPVDRAQVVADGEHGYEEGSVVVRLLTAVPRVDGLAVPLEVGRERRAVELVAYLALRGGRPITGERLRVRVLGSSSADAAAKTLFNIASALRRSLGEGPLGQRLPPAGKLSRYAVAPDVDCDVALLAARVAEAQRCADVEGKMAWLRAALELVEDEPFAAVLDGYDWFLTEGHLARLQTVCEDAGCELAELAAERELFPLARFAIERATLVEPYSERLAAVAAAVESRRQASLPAMSPALRSTVPSAPTLT